jgi:hypothetical protein
MPQKTGKIDRDDSKKVNVEIAPFNGSRLDSYIRLRNEHPNRSHPLITITDVLNEALDAFFVEATLLMQKAQPTAAATPKSVHKGGKHKKEAKA